MTNSPPGTSTRAADDAARSVAASSRAASGRPARGWTGTVVRARLRVAARVSLDRRPSSARTGAPRTLSAATARIDTRPWNNHRTFRSIGCTGGPRRFAEDAAGDSTTCCSSPSLRRSRRAAGNGEPRGLVVTARTKARRFVGITAPAGYGKSTLLAEWAASESRPVAWVSLDRFDDDPVCPPGAPGLGVRRIVPRSVERRDDMGRAALGNSVLGRAAPRLAAALRSSPVAVRPHGRRPARAATVLPAHPLGGRLPGCRRARGWSPRAGTSSAHRAPSRATATSKSGRRRPGSRRRQRRAEVSRPRG